MLEAVAAGAETAEDAATGHLEWRHGVLTVSGPTEVVIGFREQARGPSAIPWHVDLAHEDARLMALLAGAGRSARGLVRELCLAMAARQDRVFAAAVTPGGGCPLDLHRLLPVPERLLQRGADAPESLDWQRTHWGTREPLRHVRALDRSDRRNKRHLRVAYDFWSEAALPEPAVARLRQHWPELRFDLHEKADDADG